MAVATPLEGTNVLPLVVDGLRRQVSFSSAEAGHHPGVVHPEALLPRPILCEAAATNRFGAIPGGIVIACVGVFFLAVGS